MFVEIPPNSAPSPAPAAINAINGLCEGLSKATVMQSDAEFDDTYDTMDEIGRGGFAIVFSARVRQSPDRAGTRLPPESLAVKMLDKQMLSRRLDVRSLANRLRDECRVLTELKHRHVVRLVEICESPLHLYIVMEQATGGALLERIIDRGSFSEPDAQCVMLQLLDVLRFLHSHGVIHRDIKPENILLDESTDGWNIKVTDFGVVKIFSHQQSLADSLPSSTMGSRLQSVDLSAAHCLSRSYGLSGSQGRGGSSAPNGRCHTRNVGTPLYLAPEQVYSGGPYPSSYGPGVDIWSAGVVLYILCSGVFPFDHTSVPPPPVELSELTPTALRRAGPSFNLATEEDGAMPLPPLPAHKEPSKHSGMDTAAPAVTTMSHLDDLWSALHAPKKAHVYPEDLWEGMSDTVKSAIDDMLTIDPRHRPSAVAMLRHKWLQLQPPADDTLEGLALDASGTKVASSLPIPIPIPTVATSARSLGLSRPESYIEGMRDLVNVCKRQRRAEAEAAGLESTYSSACSSKCSSTEGSFKRDCRRKASRQLEDLPHGGFLAKSTGYTVTGPTAPEGTMPPSNPVLQSTEVTSLAAAAADAWTSAPCISQSRQLPSSQPMNIPTSK
eukprot:CAMPEP_0115869516 /NCGR_PEP_ID=MMETSP0287-20121206/21851_1 /TAXON_ID=412157 /ORGANISM="Chrysochromulina rotalis, Strain UIO044" /LENGTH=610 /DNA_ID=CAMNT_0003324209 /DNA_START=1 /DNA_END=1833 /DNA_ORIENTATION=-